MTILFQSHSGREKPDAADSEAALAATPADTDIAVDEQADFGYFVPPASPGTVGELDTLGNLMIDAAADPEDPAPDSTLPPVLTYWGQFLDHELTARRGIVMVLPWLKPLRLNNCIERFGRSGPFAKTSWIVAARRNHRGNVTRTLGYDLTGRKWHRVASCWHRRAARVASLPGRRS
jgi:hypothetical protein